MHGATARPSKRASTAAANLSSSWRDYYGQRKGYLNAGTRLASDMYSSNNASYIYHSGNTNQDYTYMRITRLDRP